MYRGERVLNKKKVIIVSLILVIIAIAIGVAIFLNSKTSTSIEVFGATNKNLNSEEEIIEEVKEEVIKIAVDNSPEESLLEKEEETITYNDKEITIPKRKVAAAKDSEDGQKQKSGGESATVSSFENDGQYVGIDVSSWQGNINWNQVAASGVQFAMIRVGFRGYAEEGNIKEDAYFRQNINGAISNGIKVGIYFYSTARNEAEAVQEAAWVVDKIQAYAITYPVAYDFEEFGMHRTASISGEQATNNAIAFLNYVGSKGFGTMVYASKNDITNHFQKGRLPYKFWLAHYTTATDYTGSYQMWQRTSKGSVPGISGNVDMNIAYFGYGSVAKPKHTHDFENGEEIKNQSLAATCENAGYKTMRCKECSENEKITIPALGHKWGNWTTKLAATTEKEGVSARTCSVCKKEETKPIEKLKPTNTAVNNTSTNTNANSSTNTSETNNTNSTTNTNTVEPNKHEHKYEVDASLSKPATCKEDGIQVKVCSCEEKEETILPKIDHKYSEEDGMCLYNCGTKNPDWKEKEPEASNVANEVN